MDVYILKFSACLALFVLFYKLFLENQTMHRFKRYYLLASIVFAFSVPFITFTEYVEPVQPLESFQTSFEPVFQPQNIEEPQVNYLYIVLWSIYGLGVLLFLTKFILNLARIFNKIRKNETQQSQSFIYVLLNDLVIPHSFFSYVFLNKQSYKAEQIPNEVMIHEQTHAKQKHSIDVLLIELLQIVFWFHPLVYIIKHSIKLNHEFLADEAVINQGVEPSVYQQLLIAFSSNASKQELASAINYSSIKKRFTVMNTHTSKRNIWLRSIVLLPLIAFSIYGFSEKKEIIRTSEDLQVSNSDYTARSISIEILEDGTYKIDGISANKRTLITEVNKLHQDITPEIRNHIMNIHVTSSTKISNEETWFLYNSLLDYGFYRLVTPEQEVVKGKGNTPFAIEQTQLQDTTKKIGYKDISGKKVKVIKGGEWSDVENYLNPDKSTKASLQNSIPVLDFQQNPLKLILNGKLTSMETLKADFIKITNNKASDLRINAKGEVQISFIKQIKAELGVELIKIYLDESAHILDDTISIETQIPIIDYKKQDLPTPTIPTKNSKEYKTGFIDVNGQTLFYTIIDDKTTYYNRYGNVVDKKGNLLNGNKQVNASDVIPGHIITKVYKDDKVVAAFKDK